jgi:hypothetical protein
MDQLRAIARRIMSERGLRPKFSPARLAEASAIPRAPAAGGPQLRDLRERLWVSIDNDSSRDLESVVGGRVAAWRRELERDPQLRRPAPAR